MQSTNNLIQYGRKVIETLYTDQMNPSLDKSAIIERGKNDSHIKIFFIELF